MMKVSEARMSLLGKARARPDQVRKLLDSVAQQGAVATYQKAMNKPGQLHPARVLAVRRRRRGRRRGRASSRSASSSRRPATSSRCTPRSTGSRSTCASRCPPGVAPEHAAFATVGAIAMQGVRRAEVAARRDGVRDRARARSASSWCGCSSPSGVQVVGLDTVEARCRAAEKAGALACAVPDDAGVGADRAGVLLERTGGLGADHVLLAAGGDSNGPVEIAARLARDRARIVDIGKTRLDLPWNAYYDKELDVRFSRSYGPGRYDDRYELEGIDYPAGYVRWTERRNLACFLDLLAEGSVDVASLVSGVHPVEEAADGLRPSWRRARCTGVGFLLSYGHPTTRRRGAARPDAQPPAPARSRGRAGAPAGDRQRCGSASSAPATTRPRCCCRTCASDPRVELVVGRDHDRRCPALNAQRKFGFAHDHDRRRRRARRRRRSTPSSSSPGTTRTPASSAGPSSAGKAVFVEKPLALTRGAARPDPRRRSRRPATTG